MPIPTPDVLSTSPSAMDGSGSMDAWRTGGGTPTQGGLPISAHTLETVREGQRTTSPHSRTSASGRLSGTGGSRPFPRRPSQMSRAESGRDFMGLPDAGQSKADQRRFGRGGMTGQALENHQEFVGEDSSDSDEDEGEDEEWVSVGVACMEGLLGLALTHHCFSEWLQGDRSLPFNRRRQTSAPSHTRLGAFLRRAKHKTRSILGKINDFLTVPMYSALLSIFIAMIPPLQAELNKARPLTEAIKSAGQCSSEWQGGGGTSARAECDLSDSPPDVGRPGSLFLQPSCTPFGRFHQRQRPHFQIRRRQTLILPPKTRSDQTSSSVHHSSG